MKTTLTIDQGLWTEFRAICAEKQRSAYATIHHLIAHYNREQIIEEQFLTVKGNSESVKIGLHIDKQTWTQFKVLCIRNQAFLGDTVSALLRQMLFDWQTT